jgi:hypothetical protein
MKLPHLSGAQALIHQEQFHPCKSNKMNTHFNSFTN